MTTAYVIIRVARQTLGEYVFVTTLRCFKDKSAAEAFARQQATVTQEVINGVNCQCQVAVHEIEVE